MAGGPRPSHLCSCMCTHFLRQRSKAAGSESSSSSANSTSAAAPRKSAGMSIVCPAKSTPPSYSRLVTACRHTDMHAYI